MTSFKAAVWNTKRGLCNLPCVGCFLYPSVHFVHIILGSHMWFILVIVGKMGGVVLVFLIPMKFIWYLICESVKLCF